MKRALLIVVFCSLQTFVMAQFSIYQHGTVVRMRMGECVTQHRLMAALSGSATPQAVEHCPEFTLVADKVVYVIVGKNSNQLIPLAESILFRLQKNEVAVRVDDARQEGRFVVKEMALRAEWEHTRQREQEDMNAWARRHIDAAMAIGNQE
jgi:DMSO reductase anchor subunit